MKVDSHDMIFPYLLRNVTEKAALASYDWIGRGQKEDGDGAAVDAMRAVIQDLGINGTVVIGEGEKDEAPQLYNGEKFGDPDGEHQLDIAVDPVEGTTYLAKGLTNAMATIAVAPRGSMFDPGPTFYMEKWASSPATRGKIDMNWSVQEKLEAVAELDKKNIDSVTVYILDKPRHRGMIDEVYAAGARVMLYPAGDVAGSLMASMPYNEVDVMMGTGGTPEGVLCACAIRGLGGEFMGRLDPQLPSEILAVREAGLDTKKWYDRDELCTSDDTYFCATGITSGLVFNGVERTPAHYITQTLIITGRNQERMLLANWHKR